MELQYELFGKGVNFKKSADENIFDNEYYESLSPIKVTPVYDTFWRFAFERQEIFHKRVIGSRYPWTRDKILQCFKFTNAYRSSDRVSQYLIKKVVYQDPKDILNTFFRIILFKIFNKIETWELFKKEFGEIIFEDYNFRKFDKLLSNEMKAKRAIYSAAYIMPSAKINANLKRKHSNHLKLIEMMIKEDAHKKIEGARNFREVFDILKGFPLIGNFLAYQFSIDLNYSEMIDFSENDFVVPGPGALNGIKKCFINRAGMSPVEIIKFMKDRQDFEFDRLNLSFKSLWGRPLQLIDIQNLFCEVDKYSRIAHPEIVGKDKRKRIKQKFVRIPKSKIEYWFPPKWGLNEKIR